jgi:hypothetical protein
MRKAGKPRATRRIGRKCFIIVQKSIHELLIVSNIFSGEMAPGRSPSFPATKCKQRTNS